LTGNQEQEMIKEDFENIYLGEIEYHKDKTRWEATQISKDTVFMRKIGLNESFYMSLQHFKDASSEGRFRRIDK
jgi:hypothetical protein